MKQISRLVKYIVNHKHFEYRMAKVKAWYSVAGKASKGTKTVKVRDLVRILKIEMKELK